MAGLTDQGLTIRTLIEIKGIIEGKIRGTIGETLALLPESPEGFWIAAMSELYAELWQLLQVLYNEMDPEYATGQSQISWAALTNTKPLKAVASTVVQTQTGDPGTIIGPDQLVRNPVTAVRFKTKGTVLLLAITGWTPNTSTLLGDRCTNQGKIYQAVSAGTTASSGGPQGAQSGSITDGSVLWIYVGDGTAAADQEMKSETAGRIQALAGTLTEIVNPLSGWTGTRNFLDAALGRDAEKPEALRLRRRKELKSRGKANLDAIYAPVANVTGVTAVSVFNNRTDTTDGNGIGPHGVLVLVEGGEDQPIRDAILSVVAGGTGTYGNVFGYSLDKKGRPQAISFSRPIDVLIYVTVSVLVDSGLFPLDGAEQIKRAVALSGNARGSAKDVVASVINKDVQVVEGIKDVPVTGGVKISTSPNPTVATTIPIGIFQRALYDTTRVNVIVTGS